MTRGGERRICSSITISVPAQAVCILINCSRDAVHWFKFLTDSKTYAATIRKQPLFLLYACSYFTHNSAQILAIIELMYKHVLQSLRNRQS